MCTHHGVATSECMAPCEWVHLDRGMLRAVVLCCNILWMCVEWGLFHFIRGVLMYELLSLVSGYVGGLWVWVKWGAVCFH